MSEKTYRETVITVAEAAGHLDDYVTRAHHEGQTFLLLKNGVPFARLVPAGHAVCRGVDLAAALATANLSERQAREWSQDLKAARKWLRTPMDKWQ